MSALYTYRFLYHIDWKDIDIPARRYLHKFEVHRKEIAHLKHHEKDFLFRLLKLMHRESGSYAYDVFAISEAKEFLFDWIILIHANQVMEFEGRIPGPYGLLSEAEKKRNKYFFYTYLDVWRRQIDNGEGAYCSIIKPAITRKIDEWHNWSRKNKRGKASIVKKTVFIYATFFHIYYRVKLFFDEKPKPYIIRNVNGFDIVFNVYSFVHILSRHYYPNMNKDIGISLNAELEIIDLDYLPDEILELIDKRNKRCPITNKTEYLLFSDRDDNYILWIKFKKLAETKNDGFEVRSFYKCEEQRDLDKLKEPGAYIFPLT